ncbi:endonuclease [Mucilaginibacter terrenus]|uniref:Endonuclease n=1 Tax=Mucilaginibacter terrenus TaxID=2482727 RepID=A0A3E2NX52_9SPHI|nr:endonuclease/exonuclease/phosphatase family protein [Mucilaginibacter terrenus]RFZ85501.1 endonuclease [Mucilaginibacter terrenus]
MAYYPKLKTGYIPAERRNHVIDKIISLKKQIDETVPDKDLEQNLLLATWNIRDFGKKGGFNPADRLPESYFYIAEILSGFDLIAVQEVNDLAPLEAVLAIMGNNYSYIATDVADPKGGGNGERLTFVYDKRKIWFKNVAGEIVLPPNLLISKAELEIAGDKVVAGKQFRRTPYIVSFQCGWFKFDLCTVHLYYGEDQGEKLQERIEEIREVAAYLSNRADEAFLKEKSLILLGDFNIVSPEHETMKALLASGFEVPKKLRQKTNRDFNKYYDQIAFKTTPEQLEYIETTSNDPKKQNAGVFRIFDNCFNGDDLETYRAELLKTTEGKKAAEKGNDDLLEYYHTWKTWQLSDHNLLWTRLNINNSMKYLESCRLPVE